MKEWLLPRTDGGVGFQLVAFLSIVALGLLLTRHRREWRILVVGITLLGLGLFGVRAIH